MLLYNAGLLRILFKDFVPDVTKRAKVLATELPKFVHSEKIDIFSLQELWHRPHRNKILAGFSPDEFYTVVHAADRLGGIPFGNGLALGIRKSSFEIVPEVFRPFQQFTTRQGGEGFLGRKGFLILRLRHREDPSLEFLLVNAHLQNIDVDNDGKIVNAPAQHAQTSQVRQLMDYVWKKSNQGQTAFLLTGDFNSGLGYSEQTYLDLVANPELQDPFRVLKIGAPLVTWDPRNPLIAKGPYAVTPPSRVDHQLFHNGTTTTFIPRKYELVLTGDLPGLATPGSDHNGVVVHYRLVKPK